MQFLSIINLFVLFSFTIWGIITAINKKQIAVELIGLSLNLTNLLWFVIMTFLGWFCFFIIFHVNLVTDNLIIISKTNIILPLKYVFDEFITAFGEEIWLRGFLFIGLLKLKNNIWFSVSVSSLIFCLLHSLNYSLIGFVSYFVAGVMYAIALIKLQTIWAPIALHFSWNYFQGFVYGFPVSGSVSSASIYEIMTTNNLILNGGEYGPEYSLLGIILRLFIIANIYFISHLRINKTRKSFLFLDQ